MFCVCEDSDIDIYSDNTTSYDCASDIDTNNSQ